ncbi:hypothetical protein T484DRAFT_2643999 [Baffinella frigidus]|nr:hypothetical protein T484DRAFT_2643999 [Cryptophyta sp. CCMP2293]
MPAGTAVRIVLDQAAQILVLQSKGETGIHYIQTVVEAQTGRCGRLARDCGGVVDTALNVASLQIGAARFQGFACSASDVHAGAVGFLSVKVTLKNPIPLNGMLSLSLPADITFAALPAISFYNGTVEAHVEVFNQSGTDPRCQEAPGLPCVIVRVDEPLSAGLTLTFELSNLQLPGFATQDESTGVAQDLGICRVFSLDEGDEGQLVVIDETGQITIVPVTPRVLAGISVVSSSQEAAKGVNLTVQFTTDLALAGGFIYIAFPPSYNLASATVSTFSLPSGTTYTESISGNRIILALGTDLAAATTVRFIISGVKNGPTPGPVDPITLETRVPRGTNLIGVVERNTVAMPQLTPTVLPSSEAVVPEEHRKTGASGALNLSFVTPIDIREGSAIVLILPPGFSPCQPAIPAGSTGDQNVTGVVFAELLEPKYCWLRTCNGACPGAALPACGAVHAAHVPVSGRSVRVLVDENCTIPEDSRVLIRIRNVVNALEYGFTAPVRIQVENDVCGTEKICSIDDGIDPLILDYNALADVTAVIPYSTTGAPLADSPSGPAQFSFRATNPLPLDGRVVLDVPRGFAIAEDVIITVNPNPQSPIPKP